MNIDAALEFFLNNVTYFIGTFFIICLVLIAISLFLGLKDEKAGVADKSEIKNLEETLRKVIESAPKPTAEIDTAAIEKAKKDLADKLSKKDEEVKALQKSLADAKTAVASAEDSGSGVDAEELNRKIKELQAKLSEYEIIEDDIANLSLYKDENEKLKAQLAQMGGEVPATEPAATQASEAAPEPEPQTEPDPEPVVEEDDGPLGSDDIMAEFAAAVGDEPAAEAIPRAAKADPATAQAPEPAPVSEPPSESEIEAPAPAAEAAPKEEPEAEEGGGLLDPEKIMSEAQALEEVEEIHDDEEDVDVGQKLISEFEDFVKKDG